MGGQVRSGRGAGAANVDDSRYVEIVPTEVGMAGVFGNIHAADGAALDQRLDALAATVCGHDPRTMRQRRADACGPRARGQASLACQCGSETAPQRPNATPPLRRSFMCWPSKQPERDW